MALGAGWWEARPRPLTRLKKGKLIGAKSNRGFVDTFNWMLAWIANFDVGAGLALTGAERAQPKLELNLVDGNGVPVSDGDPDQPYVMEGGGEEGGGEEETAPFTVRLHKTENDPDGQWEIYLPPGCCNVGGTCDPLNPPASDTSGHGDDDPAWRSLGDIDFSKFTFASQTASGDGQVITYSGVVEIHVKASAKAYGVDHIDNPPRRLVWASVRDDAYLDYAVAHTPLAYENFRYRDTPGDVFEADVAEITGTRYREVVDGAYQYGDWEFSVEPLRKTPIDAAVPQGTGVSDFDLVWVLAATPPSSVTKLHPGGLMLEVKKLLCVRQTAAAAGITITGDTMTEVQDASEVYARIDTTVMYDGAGAVEVLKDPEGEGVAMTSTPDVVWLQLYDLKNNTVTADHRSQSLVNLQLLHA